MGMMFGHKWISSYGESDDGTWLDGLQGLTLEEIGKGVQACLSDDREWPPTLSQFRNMCKAQGAGLTHNSAAYKVFPKNRRLTKKLDDENRKVAKRHIEAMRDLLK